MKGIPMRFRMAVLILAIFCVGTAELSPSGMLGELSRDLSVSIPTAGLLVTVYALTVVIGGPIVTVVTTRIHRKYLLALLLLVSVLGNMVCAFAPTFELLVLGRMITAIIQGTFMAVCVVTAGSMAGRGPQRLCGRGHATGCESRDRPWSSLRHPRSAADQLAGNFRQRRRARSDRCRPDPHRHPRRWQCRQVIATVVATVLCSGGMFTLITYMVPLLTDVGSIPTAWVPLILLAYDIGSIIGNVIGGRCANRSIEASVFGLSWTLAGVCVVYWIVAPSAVGSIGLLVLFSITIFALIPGLQTRILATAADAPTLSLTVNMAAFALGAALGSWAGGQVIALDFGTRAITLASAAFSALGALAIMQVVYSATDKGRGGSGPAHLRRLRHRTNTVVGTHRREEGLR